MPVCLSLTKSKNSEDRLSHDLAQISSYRLSRENLIIAQAMAGYCYTGKSRLVMLFQNTSFLIMWPICEQGILGREVGAGVGW